MEIPIKMDDLGGFPPFLETPVSNNQPLGFFHCSVGVLIFLP